MKAYLYRVGVWILSIVICYSLIFKLLPNLHQHISHIILKDDVFNEPFQQLHKLNSPVVLTFFDERKFIELQVGDEDVGPCITTTLQVIIYI